MTPAMRAALADAWNDGWRQRDRRDGRDARYLDGEQTRCRAAYLADAPGDGDDVQQAGAHIVTEADAARYLSFTPAALRAWRAGRGDGPTFIRAGRSVRYLIADLDAFLAARRVGRNPDGASGRTESFGVVRSQANRPDLAPILAHQKRARKR